MGTQPDGPNGGDRDGGGDGLDGPADGERRSGLTDRRARTTAAAGAAASERAGRRSGRYLRHGQGLEFDRMAFFADAVFAIALTLIAVDLRPPKIEDTPDSSVMWHALTAQGDNILIYLLVFFVIGSMWLGNHRFVARLGSIDQRQQLLTLVFLAIVAVLPMPASILVDHADNRVAVGFFASIMVVAGVIEGLMLAHAHTAGLFSQPFSDREFRLVALDTIAPGLVFLGSMPVLLLSPQAGMLSWLLLIPLARFTGMRISHLDPAHERD